MRKLEQLVAIVEADRRVSAHTPLLREWKCGDLTVAVDASLQVVVQADEPQAVVGDVCALVSALSRAEHFADDSRQAGVADQIREVSAAGRRAARQAGKADRVGGEGGARKATRSPRGQLAPGL